MRLLLFTGKGGVGVTSTAAATAVHAARCGLTTLLLAADGAAAGDVLQVDLRSGPVEVVPGLTALGLVAGDQLTSIWPRIGDQVAAALGGLAVDQQAAQTLTALPGVAGLLDLLALQEQVEADRWDLIVVDCPGGPEMLQWLAAPQTLLRWLDQVLPVEHRVHRAIAIGTRGTDPEQGPPIDALAAGLDRLAAGLTRTRALLTGPDCCVLLVSTGATTAVQQARRAWAALSLHGLRVCAVLANRVDQASAAELAEIFPGLAVRPVPAAATEPLGTAALTALGEATYGHPGLDPQWLHQLLDGPAELRIQVEPTAGAGAGPPGFVLSMPLPGVVRPELDLSRQGDDLIVAIGAQRRVIRLASALRRCQVTGARLTDGRLQVGFEPDPTLWPAS